MARRDRRICEDLAGEGHRRQTKEAQLTERRHWALVVSLPTFTRDFRLAGLANEDLQRGDRAHLDQKLLAHQAVDDEQRVGRIAAARKQARKFARAELGEFPDVLRVNEIARELDDVWKVRPL